MSREPTTPEVETLMKSMEERTRRIEREVKRLNRVRSPQEAARVRSEIEAERALLREDGRKLRQLKRGPQVGGDTGG
jgi:hypothetical protein